MKTFFILCLILFSIATSVFATPSLTGMTGAFKNQSTVTISGSSFGTNSLVGTNNIEWLGGSSGWIESQSASTSITTRSRWDGADAGTPMTIATDQSHS